MQEKCTPPTNLTHSSKPVLLYVEDDTITAFLFTTVFKELACSVQLFVVSDSTAALRFLQQRSPYEDAPHPTLLVLDLHLPGRDGFALLETVRQDDQFCHLPAVFFSTSQLPADHARAEILGALQFVHKPMTLGDFEKAIQLLCSLAQ